MPIDTTTPTTYPPTAEDMQDDDFLAGPSPTPAIAPPVEPPAYDTPEGAFRAEASSPGLKDFASEAMATPSRYDSDLVKDITAQIDAELEQKKLYAGTELDEFMSQRGMVGSSVEGELRKSMLGDMERQRQERLNELNVKAADAWAADRAGAADIGFKSAEFERELGGDRVNEERWQAEFGQSQYEWEEQYGSITALQQRALDLQETGMEYEEAFRRAKMEIESGQFESEQERAKSEFAAEMGEVQASRMQEYGIRKDEFDLAVKAQQDRAEAEGRNLDIDEARNLAEQDVRLKQLEQDARLAGESFDVDRERLKIQNEQFTQSMDQEQQVLEEARERRLSEMGIEEGKLENETLRIQQEAALSGRDLDLQEARDEAEIEIRTEERMEQARQANQAVRQDEARLQAEQDMFDDELTAQKDEFADRLGLETNVYNEQVEARKAEYKDRTAARLTEMGLQAGTIEHDSAMRSLDRQVEREALTLQEEGMDAETAWREADRTTMEALETERIRVQEEGIDAETAMNEARIKGEKEVSAARDTMTKEVEALRTESQESMATERAQADIDVETLRTESQEAISAEQAQTAVDVETLRAESQESISAEQAQTALDVAELRTESQEAISAEQAQTALDVEALRTESQEAIATERATLEEDLQELRLEFSGDELEERIDAREAQIGQAEAELEEKIDAREAQIGQAESELEERIDAREAQIGQLESELEEKIDAREARIGQAESELEEKIDAREAQFTQLGDELDEKITAREAQFEELAAQRTSDEAIRQWANSIQATAVSNEKAIADANRTSEYAARDADREVRKWATSEDMKLREREYKQASKDKRLEMILDAVKNDVDMSKVKEMIASVSGSVTVGAAGSGEGETEVTDFKSGDPEI